MVLWIFSRQGKLNWSTAYSGEVTCRSTLIDTASTGWPDLELSFCLTSNYRTAGGTQARLNLQTLRFCAHTSFSHMLWVLGPVMFTQDLWWVTILFLLILLNYWMWTVLRKDYENLTKRYPTPTDQSRTDLRFNCCFNPGMYKFTRMVTLPKRLNSSSDLINKTMI